MSDKSIKVTDRRMFTADGELREEFKDLESSTATSTATEPTATPMTAAQPAVPDPQPVQAPAAALPGDASSAPPNAPEADGPSFFDLIGLLAEPASIYLREARAADPQTAAQSLQMAGLHIELLAVLRDKTQGNLSPTEGKMLDDVVYQLRSGYVGLRS